MQFVETECNRILYCVLYCTVLYCTLFCAALLMRGAALYCKVLYKRWEAMLQPAPAKYVCILHSASVYQGQRLCVSSIAAELPNQSHPLAWLREYHRPPAGGCLARSRLGNAISSAHGGSHGVQRHSRAKANMAMRV